MIVSLGIFLILLVLIFIGVPIAFSIGLASLATIYLFDLGIPLTLLPLKHFQEWIRFLSWQYHFLFWPEKL